ADRRSDLFRAQCCVEGFGRRGGSYVKGSGELGATALIDGKGIGAIANLCMADHQTLVELLMEVFGLQRLDVKGDSGLPASLALEILSSDGRQPHKPAPKPLAHRDGPPQWMVILQ